MLRRNWRVLVSALFLVNIALGASSTTLIKTAIDESRRVAVRSTHPSARSEFDQGAAPDNLPMDRMQLVLKRSAAQETALDKFLDEVQQPSSPNYHKWLTPEQFGEQFGASDADVKMITAWLQARGFQVQPVNAGRTVIEFSGTAGQVSGAFRTQIHKFTVKGVDHWANASDQQIPAALADAVAGIATLHNFLSAPQSAVKKDRPLLTIPELTSGVGGHYLAPGDYATIYNVNPLYPAITGAGVTIAVVGRTNINVQDVISFRSLFGLPANPPNIILNGANPGDLGGGEEAEAVLDSSWAGALATGATVDLVVSASTNTSDGADLSEQYIINNNVGAIMTESFGSCEASIGAAQESLISTNAKQAAAEGITYLVAAGDAGSAGCDDFNTETSATGPVSVNGLGSTAYNVAVGGTQFNENGAPSLYWKTTNGSNYASALSYIPEDVWNENCTGATCGTGTILAGGGGVSSFNTKPSWQAGVTGIPNDGFRDVPDVALTAAGHDPYLLCLDGSCTSNPVEIDAIYGTSAATPSFASIVALIAQKAGGRLGQITPRLYALAAAENLSACNASNTAGLPAAGCIFNDVTVGTNAVPGEANYNTASETYPATFGYDRASGLGSVNVANLVNSWVAVVTMPAASLTPTGLIFATQTDGTTSASQTATLSNTGSAPLSVASIAISGTNAGDFAQSNNCGSALAAGGTCSITVTFTPTAAGSQTATLIVTDNSGNVAGSTQTAGLTGTGAAASSGSTTATYVGTDTSTEGTWTGKYGADARIIPNDITNQPSYGAITLNSGAPFSWLAETGDARALQTSSGASTRIASCFYDGNDSLNFGANQFSIDVNLTDGNSHQISLYLLDWDHYNRNETISILDANSKAILSTQTYANFGSGVWAIWTVKGHVTIQVSNNGTASVNAIVTGIFLDPAGTSSNGATASYVGTDTTTLGAWTGKYGADARVIPNDVANQPAYGSIALDTGAPFSWSAATADPRALQISSGASTRIASCFYDGNDSLNYGSNQFSIDVNLTDGNAHPLELYLLDWDYHNRSETITILDANSQAVLSTQIYSNFGAGVWAVWTVKGHITIRVSNNSSTSVNAIVTGIFLN